MKKIITVLFLALVGTMLSALPAQAAAPGVFYIPKPVANAPRASGITPTGRLIGTATGASPVGVGTAPIIKTVCQMQRLAQNRDGIGVYWTDVPLGGRRIRTVTSNRCVWTQPLEAGRYRLRVRTESVHPDGGKRIGPWHQSPATTVRHRGGW